MPFDQIINRKFVNTIRYRFIWNKQNSILRPLDIMGGQINRPPYTPRYHSAVTFECSFRGPLILDSYDAERRQFLLDSSSFFFSFFSLYFTFFSVWWNTKWISVSFLIEKRKNFPFKNEKKNLIGLNGIINHAQNNKRKIIHFKSTDTLQRKVTHHYRVVSHTSMFIGQPSQLTHRQRCVTSETTVTSVVCFVTGKFLLRKFHLGKFHRENSSNGKFLLWKNNVAGNSGMPLSANLWN